MKKYKAVLIAGIMLLISCKKGELVPHINGTYSGQFSVRDNPLANNNIAEAHNVTIMFNGGNYSSTANADNMPAGGQGTYSTKYDNITFKDTTIHTTDFDANQVLNGTYNYSTSGDSLLIVKQINYVFYTYKLKKQ
jgi:hypothetical protein